MTTPPATPANKGIVYAEQELGVHVVYQHAIDQSELLKSHLDALGDLRVSLRKAEDDVSDRELEIVSSEHGKHPEHSVAAMDRHLKLVLPRDQVLRALKTTVSAIADEIDERKRFVSHCEAEIKIASSRMIQQGGYFNYLAAIKTANSANTASQPTQPES